MQKLLTIYLSEIKVKHGTVEDHIVDYLSSGWRIVSICAAGGGGWAPTSAWLAVVLEKVDGNGHEASPAQERP